MRGTINKGATIFSETVQLVGEGEYNLDSLKKIDVTDHYLGLDENVKMCQHNEALHNCTTRKYTESLQRQCGCLPFNIRLSDNVSDKFKKLISSMYLM